MSADLIALSEHVEHLSELVSNSIGHANEVRSVAVSSSSGPARQSDSCAVGAVATVLLGLQSGAS